METLAEALPREQKRVREMLKIYDGIPAGRWAAMNMEKSLERAELAAASGDVVAMLDAYNDLKEYQD